jgi:hypothetical protein
MASEHYGESGSIRIKKEGGSMISGEEIALVSEMRKCREQFYTDTIALLDSALHTYYGIGTKIIPFGTKEDLISVVEKTIRCSESPVYSKYGIDYVVLGKKDVNYEEEEKYYENEYAALEKEVKNEYWKIPDKERKYGTVSRFRAFKDLTVQSEEVSTYLTQGLLLLEIENWLEYYKNLINIFFNDFKLDIQKSSSTLRFVKNINRGLYLCLEYDEENERQVLARGDFGLKKINIVVLNYAFGKKIEETDYFEENHLTIKCLGPARHPVFNDIPISINTFAARSMFEEESPGSLKIINSTKFENFPNGRVRLYNSEEFGDLIKRHAFFYMDVYSFYLSSYLKFIEECLRKTAAI